MNLFGIWKLEIGNSREAGFRNFEFLIFNFKFERERLGFTLLETVVALALIVAAAIGPLTLTARGITSAKFGRSKLIALNLAQEGVEIIRHMRENNILAGYDWRNSGSCTGCARLDNGSYQVDIFTEGNGAAPPLAGECALTPLLLVTTFGDQYEGIYSQTFGSEAKPAYCRIVIISTPGANQMRVVSQITWNEGGFDRSVQVEEVMYNWQ